MMDKLPLITYAMVTFGMIFRYAFAEKGRYYEFPFWIGVIAAGWFFPQAIAGYNDLFFLPEGAYATGLYFASICNVLLWAGYELSVRERPDAGTSWLDMDFDIDKLYLAGAAMCVFGFFFEIKLSNLPDEMLNRSQWTGIAVIYLFFSNVYYMGFSTLWLVYLRRGEWFNWKLLVFILPAFYLMASRAFLGGRRAAMMNLFSYIFVSLWFVRRFALPRTVLVAGCALGLLLINSIGVYRSIMRDDDKPLKERVERALEADYMGEVKTAQSEKSHEFRNYMYVLGLYSTYGGYDYGATHWNELVFAYVPAQFVGRDFKNALMIDYGMDGGAISEGLKKFYNYEMPLGTTVSGYADSFGSFGWFGGVKFLLVGLMMGALYRHAQRGSFLGQMLYVFTLGTAMHAISHGTNRILTSVWVYFFALGFPALFLARLKPPPAPKPTPAVASREE